MLRIDIDALWKVADRLRWSSSIGMFAATCRACYNACHQRVMTEGPSGPFILTVGGFARTWRYGVLPTGTTIDGWVMDYPRTTESIRCLASRIRKASREGDLQLRSADPVCLIPLLQMTRGLMVEHLAVRSTKLAIIGVSKAMAMAVRKIDGLRNLTLNCVPLTADLDSWIYTLEYLGIQTLELTGCGSIAECAPATTRTFIKANSRLGVIEGSVTSLCHDLNRLVHIERLELSSAGIGTLQGDAERLGQALASLPLKVLGLRGNPFTCHQALAPICRTLPITLVSLDLSFQPRTSSQDLAEACKGLTRLKSLERLELGHMCIGTHHDNARKVGCLISQLSRLRYLGLRGNCLGMHAQDIAELTMRLPSNLSELDLADNQICPLRDLPILRKLSGLAFLSLRDNGITDEQIHALLDVNLLKLS
jgi:hypothetical protein